MRIIPAIDILGGRCVRLSQGAYASQKIYSEHPVELAKSLEDHGFQYLHLVDLDGAKSAHIVNHEVLRDIVRHTSLRVDFGGGIKQDNDLQIAFDCGASQVSVGSTAHQHPERFLQWLEQYGAERILLAADAKNRYIATQGWLEASQTDVVDYIAEYEARGVQTVICTDIAKDGMLAGPSLELYREILQRSGVHLIASGGVASIRDLEQLKALGCEGAIVGKALYEGTINLQELAAL
jgi:phosphoribosylformimino-5-aminoimidazole carboxamide ribotide isomerase